ncbi:MAG: agl cluster protein AglQ [Gammaproteobacteria bacterium]|nr:agl cluster protein AglQ [Gammaproteobacteria bacterium]
MSAFEFTSDDRFARAANAAADYLCQTECRPLRATFLHLNSRDQNRGNGLIGQAWTIEALAEAGRKLSRPELLELADEVFLLHPYDEDKGLWFTIDVNGSNLGLNPTLNQQIWFAAAGGLLATEGSEQVNNAVLRFLDTLPCHIHTHPDGLIRHRLSFKKRGLVRRFYKYFIKGRKKTDNASNTLANLENGYHSFTLYGLALLHRFHPEHASWQAKSLRRAIAYANSNKFRRLLDGNPFAYGYNPVGFEMAFALDQFSLLGQNVRERWVAEQLRRCYDFDRHRMSLNTADPNTLAARIYEATRLGNLSLDIAFVDRKQKSFYIKDRNREQRRAL